jgi:hypothetical protein
MSTTTSAQANGTEDNILRPRAIKPQNPQILRTQSEEGALKHLSPLQPDENVTITGQTRYDEPEYSYCSG